MPVYLVNPGGRLIRANNSQQAMRHVAQTFFKVELAKGETVAELMSKGVKCEDARQPETVDFVQENAAPPLISGDVESHLADEAGINPEGRTQDEYLEGIASRGAPQTFIEEVVPNE